MALSFTLFVFGCASAARPDEGATAELDVPSPPRTDASGPPTSEAPVASTHARVEHAIAFKLPNPTTAPIGTTCSPNAGAALRTGPGPMIPIDSCGRNQRVSVELASGVALVEGQAKALPCKLEVVGPMAMNEVHACVADDELLMTTVCMVCRMADVGSAYHARLSELTPEQSASLWKTIGAPGETPTTPAAWAKAVAAAKR